MAPAHNRFTPSNASNPFVGTHVNQNIGHQVPHLQHPTQGLQGQNLGGHPGFGSNQNVNIFTQAGNGGLAAGFGGGGGIGSGGGSALDTPEARMRFAHGAHLQQQGSDGAGLGKGGNTRIREVWKSNLAQEMDILRSMVEKYPYISMDTEFPGVVARPLGDFMTKASYHYQTVRCNVDLLKLIQLGITLFSVEGQVPPEQADPNLFQRSIFPHNFVMCPCTWSFNFQFSLDDDMYNDDSISVLKKSGADFEKHAAQGIDPQEFGSLLVTSGLALSDDVHWISFHSGYDFAYLVKLLWCQPLPNDEEDYRNLVRTFFPNILDVKYLWRYAQKLLLRNALSPNAANLINNVGTKSGLQDLADEFGCQRVGTAHSAGSDAWLTGSVFWALKSKIFDNSIPDDMNGQMWGLTGALGVGAPASAAMQAAILAHQGPVNANGQGFGGPLSFHVQHRDGAPSTPTNHAAGLASAGLGPGGQGHSSGMGAMTPGGGGGVFGNFQYGK